MKLLNTKLISIVLLSSLILGGAFLAESVTAGTSFPNDFSGAWDFKLGDPMAPITAYYSFHRDGIMLETDSPLYKGFKSVMLFDGIKARKFDDEVFTLNYMSRVSELRE